MLAPGGDPPTSERNLRHKTRQQLIARLLLLGWSAEKIAKHLGCTSRAVRYAISTDRF